MFSLIVPNYNNNSLLKKCLESILNHETDYSRYEVVVVDDGSSSAELTQIRKLVETASKYVSIKLIEHKENKGFSQAVNTGIDHSKGDVLVLVNTDIIVTKPFIDNIKDAMGMDEKIGIVGALLLYPDNRIQHAGVQIMNNGWWGHNGLGLYPNPGHPALKSNYFPGVTGAFFAMKKAMVEEIGGYDINMVGAYEDVEYCMRAWEKGWRVWMDNRVQAYHLEGATRGNNASTKMTKHPYMWYREQVSTRILQNKMKPDLMQALDEQLSIARKSIM